MAEAKLNIANSDCKQIQLFTQKLVTFVKFSFWFLLGFEPTNIDLSKITLKIETKKKIEYFLNRITGTNLEKIFNN